MNLSGLGAAGLEILRPRDPTKTLRWPFGTTCERYYDLGLALTRFCLPVSLLGKPLAISSAAADFPFIRATAEVERSVRYTGQATEEEPWRPAVLLCSRP